MIWDRARECLPALTLREELGRPILQAITFQPFLLLLPGHSCVPADVNSSTCVNLAAAASRPQEATGHFPLGGLSLGLPVAEPEVSSLTHCAASQSLTLGVVEESRNFILHSTEQGERAANTQIPNSPKS